MRHALYCVFCLLLITPLVVGAEPPPPSNRVSFQVSASEDIDSDLLVVRLFVQHQAREQAAAATRVNEDMAWALGLAKSVTAVRAETLDYRTNPVYDQRKIQAWQTRQSLRLESADNAALTALLGTLQERLGIESLGYEVSAPLREAAEQRLIVAAIERFSARASRVTAAFARQRYTLVEAHINSEGGAPPPIAYQGRALAMKTEVADPSIAAGAQTMRVGISGTIELSAD